MRRYTLAPWGRLVREPAFIVCVLVLGICAGSMKAGGKWLQWHFRKFPAPLRKSLDELDESQLRPYVVVKKSKIDNEEVEQELGTEEYIQWQLEDTEAAEDDPARFAYIFVTYYTGNPDKVPHVPDWCYVGSGGEVTSKKNTTIHVANCGLAEEGEELEVRVLEIMLPGEFMSRRKQIVTYFFAVNGRYECTRTRVRQIQNNWRDRHAYFSKVEITFWGKRALSAEASLSAAEKLSRKLIPILWSQHWPDWSAFEGSS